MLARSILLFGLAAVAEIGGAWLIWQGWREHRGLWWIAAGIIALHDEECAPARPFPSRSA